MIFVVGVGRSGTSALARVLHQSGLCCMGHEFHPPDEGNPTGYWEDLHIRQQALEMFMNQIGDAQDFYNEVQHWHEAHNCRLRFGFKHPMLWKVKNEQWHELMDIGEIEVFWAKREREANIHSIEHWKEYRASTPGQRHNYTVTRKDAEALWDRRWEALHEALWDVPHTSIDFTDRLSNEEIIAQIKEGMCKNS